MSVVIVGAGLGGLSLAQGLRKAGIPCQVYERDASPEARLQGYRLHIGGDGDRALREVLPHGLHGLFRATSGRALPRTNIYDERLRPVAEVPMSDGPHLNVNRFTLRQILLHGVDVQYGKRFTHYTTDSHGVTAHFDDGTTAFGELLIGADGVNSPVRQQYLPHAKVVDTGLVQLYGRIPLTPHTRELFDPEMFAVFSIAAADGRMLGFAPVDYPEPVADACARWAPDVRLRDGEPYMTCGVGARREVVGHTEAELWEMSGAQLRALALDLLDGWDPRARALVEHWDVDATFPLSIRTSVPLAPWRASRVTLVGDAIHAMSPAAGAGANTALRDGAALAAALAADASLLDAVGAYEASMVEYGFAAVRESAANGQRVMGQDPLPTGV